MNNSELIELKNTIEGLSVHHQTEILSILHNFKHITLNENQNGTFINLSLLDKKVIELLKKHIAYVQEQITTLSEVENEKIRLEKEFFN